MSGKPMFIEKILDILFPRTGECLLCSSGSCSSGICRRCQKRAADTGGLSSCSVCGRYCPALGIEAAAPYVCLECRAALPAFFAARSVGPYQGSLKEVIHLFKYKGYRSLAVVLGQMLTEVFLARPEFSGTDVLVPVPLSREKLGERGFNQSELLAREMGKYLGLPVSNALTRTINNPSQSKLSASARRRAVRGIFVCSDKPCRGNVLLIDDILTTGATAGECASVLLQGAAEDVGVLTLAAGVQEKVHSSV